MNINSESKIKPSHHHIITRSLQTLYFYDGIIGKITNNLRHSNFCDNFEIFCGKYVKNSNLYWKILSIMSELMYTIKALQPDVLPESDYLPVYAAFQSYPAFLGNKTPQKQADALLKKSKTQASYQVNQILCGKPTRVLPPYTPSLKRTPSRCTLFQRYDSNPGQITLNKEIRTMQEVAVFHKPGLYVFTGGGVIIRILE